MSRTKGTFDFAGNFDGRVRGPLDAKQRVENKADLTGSTTWLANTGGEWTFPGMIVSVFADTTPSNNGIYRLTTDDFTNILNWEQIGSSGDISSLSTALVSGDLSLSTAIISGDLSLSTVISSGYESLSTVISSGYESLSTVISITDTSLSTAVSTNISTANESLSTAISTNISTSDNSLSTAISTNISTGNESLSTVISTSISTSDNSLSTVISTTVSTESSTRSSGDTSLSISISSEVSTRISADNTLLKKSGITSDILYWNSGSSMYTPYSSNVTAATAGKFYLGGGLVTADDLNLNYTGGMSINSLNQTALLGRSDFGTGVVGQSTDGDGGSFSSSSGNAIRINKNGSLGTNDNNNVMSITRTNSVGSWGLIGDIINITDNPTVTSGYVSGSTFKAIINSITRIDFNPRIADSGTSVAYFFDTNTGLTTTGSKLMSVQNNGIEQFYIDYSGNTVSTNTRKIKLVTLTTGVTTTWDMTDSCSAYMVMGGDITTLDVINTVSGDNGTLIVEQDVSGNWEILGYPTNSKFAGGQAGFVLSVPGGSVDIISFYYDGVNYYWNMGKNYIV